MVCDGYVKYEEADVDRLVAILKTTAAAAGTVWNTVSSPPRRGLLNKIWRVTDSSTSHFEYLTYRYHYFLIEIFS